MTMWLTCTGSTLVTFIDIHPLPRLSPARLARRRSNAKEKSSINQIVSSYDLGSSKVLMLGRY